MNNNQNQQGFQKQGQTQPQTPRSPEKMSGALRDGGKPSIKPDDKTKYSGARTDEFKPEHKTVAKSGAGKKNMSVEDDESFDTETAYGAGRGTGKAN